MQEKQNDVFDAFDGDQLRELVRTLQPLPTGAVSESAKLVAAHAVPLGEILVDQGDLTPMQVNHLLDVQSATPRSVGDLAERLFGVSPRRVAEAWVEQYVQRHGVHDLSDQPCDAKCISLLEARQAWQFRLAPLRKLDDGGAVLMATDRQSLIRAVQFAGQALPVAPTFLVAERDSLRDLLRRNYPVSNSYADLAFPRAGRAA